MKRSFLLMIAAVAIAFAGVGSYVGWQVDAQEGPPPVEICNNGIDDDSDEIVDECVLILGTTVTGSPSPEQVEAEALGFVVQVDDAAAWGARTTASFASYRAIILGDPKNPAGTDCSNDPINLAPAEANRTTWTPAVTGNVVVIGTDPVSFPHSGDTSNLAGKKLTANGIKFAAGTMGKTGAYITLSCYYVGASTSTPVPVLDQFGSFTVIGGGFNDAHITAATHPVVNDPNVLLDADLNYWLDSIHERFETMPAPFFEVAELRESESQPDGLSYIIARGPVQRVVTSGPKTFSPTQLTQTFERNPGSGAGYFATLTFLGTVITTFQVEVFFVTVDQALEDVRLGPAFPAGTTCITSNLPADRGGCIRHTIRKVGGGVPQQGVDFTGNFRLELGFHTDDIIVTPGIAQAQSTIVTSPIDYYDRDIIVGFKFGSCNCVGVGETDGFSDFLNINVGGTGAATFPVMQVPLPPLRSDGLSVIKSGRALPVRFSITAGPGGAPITDAIASFSVQKVANLDGTLLVEVEPVPTDAIGPSTGTLFIYHGGAYQFIADTKGWPTGFYIGIITFLDSSPIFPGLKVRLTTALFDFAVR